MKYIIGESRLDKLIYDFIDNSLDNGKLNYMYPDYYGSSCSFFKGEYDSDEETLIYWYSPNYWDNNTEGKKLKEKSPIIDLANSLYNKYTNFFGDRWKPVFIQWFNDKFPGFGVKTLIQDRGRSYFE